MPVTVTRKNIIFQPDASRVITRFFANSEERNIQLIKKIMEMPEKLQQETLLRVLRDFSRRHRSISKAFEKNFNRLAHIFPKTGIDPETLSTAQKVLIGAYFTMEYSIEAAAFFNPSIMEDPDQSELSGGEKRVIISFRATGEGHISSIVFRSGIIDHKNNILIEPPGRLLESPEHVKNYRYEKISFLEKIKEMQEPDKEVYDVIEKKLTETFTYEELKRMIEEARTEFSNNKTADAMLNEMKWLASSHYEMNFSVDTAISERVIFPIADTEIKGIEDARFVRFTDDNGEITYYATYTAYDGYTTLPKLLLTKDFYHFTVRPLHGEVARNKGMALFPRKINGKYVMLCRGDGMNNFISFSNDITVWRSAELLQKPVSPWELVQMGNCGSPLETDAGWLVITHGVGPVREYSLGATLLDINDPSKEIGRLMFPLLSPNEKEREGYVPNVVYSCGAIIHNENLIIPYAMSDHASTYATVNLAELLEKLKE
ncbi:MAG: glycoside hydrolase family 130 protein [Ferruginibacter sp.]